MLARRWGPFRLDAIVAAAAIAGVLSILAFVVTPGDALFSIDAGVKLVQAMALKASHFKSTALPYPGQAIDPDGTFFPFISPFVFLSAGQYQSIFPSPYPVLSALLLPFGVGAVRLIGILAITVTGPGLVVARWLVAGRRARIDRVLLWLAAPIAIVAIADWAWLSRPPLAHLRHAAPGAARCDPRQDCPAWRRSCSSRCCPLPPTPPA